MMNGCPFHLSLLAGRPGPNRLSGNLDVHRHTRGRALTALGPGATPLALIHRNWHQPHGRLCGVLLTAQPTGVVKLPPVEPRLRPAAE